MTNVSVPQSQLVAVLSVLSETLTSSGYLDDFDILIVDMIEDDNSEDEIHQYAKSIDVCASMINEHVDHTFVERVCNNNPNHFFDYSVKIIEDQLN